MNALTGVITTVAGNGTAGSSGDGGQATAAELNRPQGVAVDSHGDLFIADGNNNAIREVNASTGVITTVAGMLGQSGFSGDGGQATAALLNFPTDVQVDSQGDLFITDSVNNRIREVNAATGVITTIAGNGSRTFAGDNGPATAASLNGPTVTALDGHGNLFIVDSENDRPAK